MTPFSGVTLVELLVVLVLLGLAIGLSPLARAPGPQGPDDAGARLAAARLLAARQARPVPERDQFGRLLLALPDGSVLGPGVTTLIGAAYDPHR